MVTVKRFKEVGFIFDFGDKISNEKFNLIIDCGSVLDAWNENSCIDCKSFVDEVNWRINKGTQPVDDNLWVEVLYVDGEKDLTLASEFCWGNEDNLTHWKPSLKHLEKQMNDNQETKTALEMSERDIESYADDCDVERELKESDEVIWNNGDLCKIDGHHGDWQFGCDVPNSNLVIVFRVDSSSHMTMYKSRLLKPEQETTEEKAGRELWGIRLGCSDLALCSWSELTDKSKDEWIEFAKRLGFTTGI